LKFLRTQPILRQVAVAAFLLMLLVAVAVVWSGNQARLERTDEVQAEAGRIATTATALLDEYFSSLDAMASLLVRHPAVTALDRTASAPLFAQIMSEQPLLNNILLRGPDGRLVASGVPVSEYTALQLKQAVVGYGRATKEQMQQMVVRLLGLSGVPGTDAADALGMAICHAHGGGGLATLGGIAPSLAKKGLRVRRGRLIG